MEPVRTETSHGRLVGLRLEHDQACFLGVPYAAPPIGELRFRATQPLPPWSGEREATKFAPSSVQPPPDLSSSLPGDPAEQSEDCLYLNIWTPACDGGKRPVMVWLHGGGYVGGSPNSALYSGAPLSREGVVVVNVGYRLGALGWLSHPELAGSAEQPFGNWGLSDQLAALSWVRENAAAFGGDPERVTVFGESAGGMSVAALLGTEAPRRAFDRAIIQSGAAMALGPDTAAGVAESFCRELGLDGVSLEALRAVPPADLLLAQAAVRQRYRALALPFQPVCGEPLLQEHPAAAIERGSAVGMDLLIGTNRDEWRFWMLGDLKLRQLDDLGALQLVTEQFEGVGIGSLPEAQAAIEAFRGFRAARGEGTSAVEVYSAIASDWTFRVPSMRLAAAQAGASARVFTYLFDWESPLLEGLLGSCHALELPFVFGALDNSLVAVFSGSGEAANSLSAAMMGAWSRFAAVGDPSGGAVGPWPGYDPVTRATKRLGLRMETIEKPMEGERALLDGLFGPFGEFEAANAKRAKLV